MIASSRFPTGLSVFLVCVALSPSVLADAWLVPLDGSQEGVEPADFGYRIDLGRCEHLVRIHMHLDPEAARRFHSARLTLTRTAEPAGRWRVTESTLGLERTADRGGQMSVIFDARSVDGGEIVVWSAPFEHRPVIARFGGFRISIGKLLANAAKEMTDDEPGEHESPQAEMLPPGAILRLGEKLADKRDPDDDVAGPSPDYPVAFSRDGSILATGDYPARSWDRSVVLWNLKTGQELRRLHVDREVLMALAFSPDGTTLAWGGYGKVHLWDHVTGGRRLQLETQEHTNIASLAFSADGRRIAAIGGRQIHVWDAATGQEVRRFAGDGGWARSVAISPDGQMLAAAIGASVDVWDIESGGQLRRLPDVATKGSVRSVAFSPDGKLLLAAGDRRLRLWDTATWEVHLTRDFESTWFFTAAFAPDGTTFAACTYSSVWFLRTDSGREIFSFEPYGQTSDFSAFAFSPDGKTFATSDDRGAVLVWETGKLLNDRRAMAPTDLPVGRWKIEFANGVVQTCEIRRDGTALAAEPDRTSGGRVVTEGGTEDGSLVIAFDDDRVERWTPVGRRMVVEHWYPADGFPRATPVVGIADRALTEDGAGVESKDRLSAVPAEDGRHAFFLAVSEGRFEDVAKAVQAEPELVNAEYEHGGTPLYWAAFHGHEKIAALLLEHGAEVDARGHEFATPLYQAAYRGHAGTVKLLLKHGANIEAVNKGRHTPLYAAVSRNHEDVVGVLLEAGANPNGPLPPTKAGRPGVTVPTAVGSGSPLMLAVLSATKRTGEIELTPEQQQRAEERRQTIRRIARMLIVRPEARLDELVFSQRAPLHMTAAAGDLELTRLLLEQGADPNIRDRSPPTRRPRPDGFTPLHHAAAAGNVELMDLLRQHGANPNIRNSLGQTPADLLREHKGQKR